MAKSGKKLPIFLGIIVVLAVIGVIAVMNFSSVAKSLSEKIASDALGVGVTIDSLDIQLQERKIALSGIKVKNPPGYDFPYAFTLDSISIDADALTKELLTFDDISVGKSDLYFETGSGGTNLGNIKDNIKTTEAEPAQDKTAEAIKVIIRKFTLGNATLHSNLSLDGKPTKVDLPEIVLTGIGEKSNGILASEAIGQIVDKVVNVASKTAAQEGLLKGVDPSALENLDVPTSLMDKVGKDAGSLGEGIKGLLGN